MVRHRKTRFYILMLAVLAGLGEISFYYFSRLLPPSYYYHPPTRKQFEYYLDTRVHPTLGWTLAGYRNSPAGKNHGTPCLSLYGDSFTYGTEVNEREAWGNVLASLLGCRVDNYGVWGYGSDQAYMRFLENKGDPARWTVLTHLTENIVRNVNQDQALIYIEGITLKPRFITDETGTLERIDIPRFKRGDYEGFVERPGDFLHHEYFLPNAGRLSKGTLGFPYLIRLPRVLAYKRIYMGLLAKFFATPSWFAEMYDPDHPSRALQVTRDILIHFDRVARERGKEPVVFLLPVVRDLKYFRATGKWVHQPLLDELVKNKIRVFNLGEGLLQRAGDGDLCDFFCTDRLKETGHFTARGNQVLAEAAREILTGMHSFSDSANRVTPGTG